MPDSTTTTAPAPAPTAEPAPVPAPAPAPAPTVAATLGLGRSRRSFAMLARRALWWVVPLLAVAGGVLLYRARRAPAAPSYDTVVARRGGITVAVTATGTLAPMDTVYVGTEVSGIVDVVAADFNDRVRKGETLAVVNTDQLRAQIRQGEAALRAAEASAQQTAATLVEVRAQAVRAESLFAGRMLSAQDVESARAALARATAADASARAQIAGARAALDVQRTALGKAVIRAPISGIVLQRQVERGRTVTAAFQTPTLFVLAADLSRMTLALDVDEADIGQVATGQDAQFTVDAFPDRTFEATVRSVRNDARTVEGVVTYQAMLDVANEDLALRPGMTATARIITARVRDALLIPNAALRYVPSSTAARDTSRAGAAPPTPAGARHVWTMRDGRPASLPVTTGLSDGQWTVITGGAIAPGTPLIVGEGGSVAAADSTRRPGAPSGHPPLLPFGGRRGR